MERKGGLNLCVINILYQNNSHWILHILLEKFPASSIYSWTVYSTFAWFPNVSLRGCDWNVLKTDCVSLSSIVVRAKLVAFDWTCPKMSMLFLSMKLRVQSFEGIQVPKCLVRNRSCILKERTEWLRVTVSTTRANDLFADCWDSAERCRSPAERWTWRRRFIRSPTASSWRPSSSVPPVISASTASAVITAIRRTRSAEIRTPLRGVSPRFCRINRSPRGKPGDTHGGGATTSGRRRNGSTVSFSRVPASRESPLNLRIVHVNAWYR